MYSNQIKLFIAFFLFFPVGLFAQNASVQDCNTIFVCIDSASYQQLFTNAFIKDTLFFCRENSTATADDHYQGKYAIGKAATLEFFHPTVQNKQGDHFGDLGIEFKTRKPGRLDIVMKKATQLNIAVDSATTYLDNEDGRLPWYNTLSVKHPPAAVEMSMIEYQPAYLQYMGFSESEINRVMTYACFNNKLSNGRKYPRKFNQFKSASVQITNGQLDYIRQFAALNNMRHGKGRFYTADFTLYYTIVKQAPAFPLTRIEISLTQKMKQRFIKITDHISLQVKDDTGIISFQY